MFSVITNIYNKKTKGSNLMELLTATGKEKKFFFWQLEMFGVCTAGDTAHIETIFKFQVHGSVHRCNNLNKNANQMYFVSKSFNFIYTIPLYSYNIAGLEDTTNQAPHGTRDCMCSWEAPDDGHNGVRNM